MSWSVATCHVGVVCDVERRKCAKQKNEEQEEIERGRIYCRRLVKKVTLQKDDIHHAPVHRSFPVECHVRKHVNQAETRMIRLCTCSTKTHVKLLTPTPIKRFGQQDVAWAFELRIILTIDILTII